MDVIDITVGVTKGFSIIKDSMEIFTQAPAIYFVSLALIGAATGVAKKFVPMKRR